MKVVFFILVGIIMLIFLILIGIKFKVLCLLHSKNKSMYYTLNHKFFSVMQGKAIVLDEGGYSIVMHKNKIIPKSSKEGFGFYLGKEIVSVIKINRLDVYIDTAKTKDAMITALVQGGISSIAGIIASIMKNKNILTEFHISNERTNEDFTMAINLNIKISLLQFIFAYLRANKEYKLNYKKEKKYA